MTIYFSEAEYQHEVTYGGEPPEEVSYAPAWKPDILSPSEIRRDEIRLKVLFGEISPEEAEEEAKQKDLGPFMVTPAPMKICTLPPFWSPKMAAIWITTKDPVQVQRHVSDPPLSATAWVPNGEIGYQGHLIGRAARELLFKPDSRLPRGNSLVDLPETSIFEQFHDFSGHLVKFPESKTWYPELRSLLNRNVFEATGIEIRTGRPTTIGREYWPYATFILAENLETVLYIDGEPIFRLVQFKGKDMLDHFPPEGSSEFRAWPDQKTQMKKLTKLQRWLFEKMKMNIPDGFPVDEGTKHDRNLDILDKITPSDETNSEDRNIDDEKRIKAYKNPDSKAFGNLVDRTEEALFGKDPSPLAPPSPILRSGTPRQTKKTRHGRQTSKIHS